MSTYDKVYEVVLRIPAGSVASYGQVSRAAGMFRGARIVGWALGCLPPDTDIPWQRVVNQKGWLSIVNPRLPKLRQKELLEREGVIVAEKGEGHFVIESPLWHEYLDTTP
jgi:methylated-DNA-protein-cysteine methyltransferase-like protein